MSKNKIISFDFVKKVFKGEYKRPWSSVKCFKDAEKEIRQELSKLEIDWSIWKPIGCFYYIREERQNFFLETIAICSKQGEIRQFAIRTLLKEHFDFNK